MGKIFRMILRMILGGFLGFSIGKLVMIGSPEGTWAAIGLASLTIIMFYLNFRDLNMLADIFTQLDKEING